MADESTRLDALERQVAALTWQTRVQGRLIEALLEDLARRVTDDGGLGRG